MLTFVIIPINLSDNFLKSVFLIMIYNPTACKNAPGVMSPSLMNNNDWSLVMNDITTVPMNVIKVPAMNNMAPLFLSFRIEVSLTDR